MNTPGKWVNVFSWIWMIIFCLFFHSLHSFCWMSFDCRLLKSCIFLHPIRNLEIICWKRLSLPLYANILSVVELGPDVSNEGTISSPAERNYGITIQRELSSLTCWLLPWSQLYIYGFQNTFCILLFNPYYCNTGCFYYLSKCLAL